MITAMSTATAMTTATFAAGPARAGDETPAPLPPLPQTPADSEHNAALAAETPPRHPALPPARGWAFFPGIYRPYGGHQPVGVEVSALYRGVGLALGAEPELHFTGARYGEAEVGLWLVSLGVGVRSEGGKTGRQVTWALPLLPIFPYGRIISLPGEHRNEIGLMLKLPLFDFNHLQGVL